MQKRTIKTGSRRTEIESKLFEFKSGDRGWGKDLGNLGGELMWTETSQKYF